MGLLVFDADLTMQKKQEVKALLELANHEATWAVDQAMKTEGIIELTESEAISRFAQRMADNGGYRQENNAFIPGKSSVTTDPLAFLHYYIDFQQWRKDTQLSLRFTGEKLLLDQAAVGSVIHPAGGELKITVTTETGERLTLAPKRLIGPSLVAVAYVHDRPLTPLLTGHAFPVVSVEELKW